VAEPSPSDADDLRTANKGDRKEEFQMKRLSTPLRNQRGVAVPLMAVCMLALVGLAAVGIDTGRVASVANEAQNAADIAATAGAMTLAAVQDPDAAEASANQTLAKNYVNGTEATEALQTFEVGNISPDYTFTAGMQPFNAARAVAGSTVSNVLLDMVGASHSTLSREAIATLSGLGSGIPTLPIVIGECHFNSQCYHQSSNSHIYPYFPEPCGDGVEQTITVGDAINLGNGQVTPLLNRVECLVNTYGQTQFTIPIVECDGNFNQAKTVVGFAKIEVDFVISTGSPKGIWLHGLYEGQQPGPPGGGQFGLMAVSLVK
jgi:Flp pilus assembly protein TadG